jgi:hypothetical protein
VITEPNSPSDGTRVAMIEHNGAPIELIEFGKISQSNETDSPQQHVPTNNLSMSG